VGGGGVKLGAVAQLITRRRKVAAFLKRKEIPVRKGMCGGGAIKSAGDDGFKGMTAP